jgi:hypothetical protein
MAESLLVRKGGGGAKIEETLQNFTVASGETIEAGKFVDYENTFNTSSLPSVLVSGVPVTAFSNKFKISKIDKNRIVYTFRNNQPLVASGIVNFNGSSFVVQTSSISSANNVSFAPSVIAYSDGKIVYAFVDSGGVRVSYAIVNGNSMYNHGSAVQFNTFPSASDFAITNLTNDRALIAYSDGNISRGRLVIANFSLTSITLSSSSTTFDTTANANFTHLITLRPIHNISYLQTVLIVYRETNAGNLRCVIASVNGEQVTGPSLTSPVTVVAQNIADLDVILLESDGLDTHKLLAVFKVGSEIRAVIINVNSTTITNGSIFVIDSGITAGLNLTVTKTSNNRALVGYAKDTSKIGHLKVLHINGNTITSPESSFIYNNNTTDNAALYTHDEDTAILMYTSPNQNDRIRVQRINGIKQIKNAILTKIFGLAKTGGTAGQTVEVFVNE